MGAHVLLSFSDESHSTTLYILAEVGGSNNLPAPVTRTNSGLFVVQSARLRRSGFWETSLRRRDVQTCVTSDFNSHNAQRESPRLLPGHCEVVAILRAEVRLVPWSFSPGCSDPQGFCFGVVFPRFFQRLRNNVPCLSRRRFYWEAKVNEELWGKVSKHILNVCVWGE